MLRAHVVSHKCAAHSSSMLKQVICFFFGRYPLQHNLDTLGSVASERNMGAGFGGHLGEVVVGREGREKESDWRSGKIPPEMP